MKISLGYTGIETLEEYVLVAHDRREVTLFRRSERWQPKRVTEPNETLELGSLGFTMPLADIYDRVQV